MRISIKKSNGLFHHPRAHPPCPPVVYRPSLFGGLRKCRDSLCRSEKEPKTENQHDHLGKNKETQGHQARHVDGGYPARYPRPRDLERRNSYLRDRQEII